MRGQKKRQADVLAVASEAPENPNPCEVQIQIDATEVCASLRKLPPPWFWYECAAAQLRILATNPDVCAHGMAMWRYCVCLSVIRGPEERWTGNTAGLIQAQASNAKGAHRWKIRFLQNLVDFVAVWVPLVLREVHLAGAGAEIPQVETDQPLDGRFAHEAKR